MTESSYLHGHHESVLSSHRQRTADNSAAYLLPRLRPDSKILDVGCGPGTITSGLAARVPLGTVLGIDSSLAIIEEAREQISPEVANLSFEVGNAYRLDYPDASFDVVHAHQVMQHLADPVRALAEMRRVCRPGGVVACRDADYGTMSWYPCSPELSEWQSLYRAVARSIGGEPDAGRYLYHWAAEAGFPTIEISASVWCFYSDSERRWWGTLWAERLLKSSFADHAERSGLADRSLLEQLSGGWRTWMQDAQASFYVPNIELLCQP
jgi:ubiquinone/menaquinone biosynthesis C-methylase UbiE